MLVGQGRAYHLRAGDHAALDDHTGLCAEVARFPQDQVGQLAYLDATDDVAHSLRDGWVDGVFTDVPLHSEVVNLGAFVFLEEAALHFVLVRGVPGAEDDFAAAAHGLRVRRHHADGAEIVENVFGCDGFGADAGFGEGDIFGDVATEMVADHQHVEVLVQSVPSVGACRVGAAGKDVAVFDYGDDVWGVSSAGTFGVVCVNGPVFEGGDCLFDETGLVEGIGVDEALDVVFVADVEAAVDGCWSSTPIFVEFQTGCTSLTLFSKCSGVAIVTFAGDTEIDG